MFRGQRHLRVRALHLTRIYLPGRSKHSIRSTRSGTESFDYTHGWGGRTRTFSIRLQRPTLLPIELLPNICAVEVLEYPHPTTGAFARGPVPLISISAARRATESQTHSSGRRNRTLIGGLKNHRLTVRRSLNKRAERVRRIEPLSQAWKARALPIYQTRVLGN